MFDRYGPTPCVRELDQERYERTLVVSSVLRSRIRAASGIKVGPCIRIISLMLVPMQTRPSGKEVTLVEVYQQCIGFDRSELGLGGEKLDLVDQA